MLGSSFQIVSPAGKTLRLRVEAILDQGKFDLDPLLGSIVISQQRFDGAFPRPLDLYTFVNAPSVVPVSDEQIRQGVEEFPGVRVLPRAEFVADRSEGIAQILNLLYVLLALSVVVSLFGMVNTLVLAVFERTRELGMLRAIGLTRRQTRRMVRHESVITALIGAALGLPLGVGLAAAVTRSSRSTTSRSACPPERSRCSSASPSSPEWSLRSCPPAGPARLDVLDALGYE